jgi:predicted nucleotidyltransferase
LRAHGGSAAGGGNSRSLTVRLGGRAEARLNSGIDLAAEFDPAAKIDLIRLVGLERELGDPLGREVQILPEPIRKPRLRAEVERDRIRAF